MRPVASQVLRLLTDARRGGHGLGVESSASAVALLGLPDFVVLAATEVDGELHQLIETTADRVGCPECGVVALPHGRRPVWVRDLPAGGRPVALRWRKRVWR